MENYFLLPQNAWCLLVNTIPSGWKSACGKLHPSTPNPDNWMTWLFPSRALGTFLTYLTCSDSQLPAHLHLSSPTAHLRLRQARGGVWLRLSAPAQGSGVPSTVSHIACTDRGHPACVSPGSPAGGPGSLSSLLPVASGVNPAPHPAPHLGPELLTTEL